VAVLPFRPSRAPGGFFGGVLRLGPRPACGGVSRAPTRHGGPCPGRRGVLRRRGPPRLRVLRRRASGRRPVRKTIRRRLLRWLPIWGWEWRLPGCWGACCLCSGGCCGGRGSPAVWGVARRDPLPHHTGLAGGVGCSTMERLSGGAKHSLRIPWGRGPLGEPGEEQWTRSREVPCGG
jgi:hypothetical protein